MRECCEKGTGMGDQNSPPVQILPIGQTPLKDGQLEPLQLLRECHCNCTHFVDHQALVVQKLS